MNKKSMFCLFLTIALLFSLSFIVFAEGNMPIGSINTGEMDMIPGKSVEKLAYGMAPENVYPFVYTGSPPSLHLNIDTSGCAVGKMYVFDKDTEEVIPIGNDTVEMYACTKDYLFYTTNDGRIFQTDYSGSFFVCLYATEQNEISKLISFGEYLYFIKGGNSVVIINTASNETSVVLSGYPVSSVFMFDDNQMIWRNEAGEPNYYNIDTGNNIVLANEHMVNCLVSLYIAPELDDAGTAVSINAIDSLANDVSFPLPEYPANPGYGLGVDNVLSRFTIRYAGSGECDGFAKYAHDRYLHIEDENRDTPSWEVNGINTEDHCDGIPFNSASVVVDFFESLHKGAFVRYTTNTDETPWDGRHSIVFDKIDPDNTGVWVYECNQDFQNGVGYRKYTFSQIFGQYSGTLYYVTHSFGNQMTFDNSSYHKVFCNRCDGYLRQAHPSRQSIIATKNTHTTSYSCCGGSQILSHTAVRQTAVNSTLNHRIYYSCCSGYVTESHSYSSGTCTVCGYTRGGSIVEPVGEDLECERA